MTAPKANSGLPGSRINLKPQGSWPERAACSGANSDLFVPDHAPRPQSLRRAAEYCGVCPVRAECLADADANGLTGVWGGFLLKAYGVRRPLLRVAS